MKLLDWFRHLLTPHHTNNHKARILHPSVLSVVVAGFLIYQFGINFALIFQPSILGFASNISPDRVVELTNQERLKQGLTPLKLSSTLSQAAQLKAGDMFAQNYWSHTSPSGRDPWSFFQDAGYSYLYAGENLARDFMNSESVIQAWMNSPTHRDNIVNDKYQEIGLAVVNGTLDGVETTLVVQLFATPTPAPAVPVQQPAATSQLEPAQGLIGLLSEPTATPLPQPVVGEASQVVEELALAPATLAQSKGEADQMKVSPFSLTKSITIFLLGIILGVLALDAVLVYRKKVVRLSGRNIAHLIFIGALLLVSILTSPGAIL
jgi:uncharacterized protein YkwD